MRRADTWWGVVLLSCLSCTGQVLDAKVAEGEPSTPHVGTGDSTTLEACPTEEDPGPVFLRRLSSEEYQRAVFALTGVDVSAEVQGFPQEGSAHEFRNDASQQTISALLADRYFAVARSVATQALGAATRQSWVGCDAAQAGCLSTFVSRLGRRAFRRPVENEELERYLALAHSEADPWEGASLVVQAFLQSPSFLFRPEVGVPRPDGKVQLSGFEVATRLAFFIWAQPPDDALLDAAERGDLDTTEGVRAMAAQMLQDPRARSSISAMLSQWFRLGALSSVQRDPGRFPAFRSSLLSSMKRELELLFDAHVWGAERNFLSVYSGRFGFVDAALAGHYGLAAPASGFEQRDLSTVPDRGGLFGTAGWLTITSRRDETSPIQRGVFVREAVLCDSPPPPPAGVPVLESAPGEAGAEAESRHTRDPACAGCHGKLDPVGHGLERYDSLGALRTHYSTGAPVRETGEVRGVSTQTFGGGPELGALVAQSRKARQCAVAHVFRWAFGRHEDREGDADACTLQNLEKRFVESGHSLTELFLDVVASDAFRLRRAPAGEAP